jgi:hypothetical protein
MEMNEVRKGLRLLTIFMLFPIILFSAITIGDYRDQLEVNEIEIAYDDGELDATTCEFWPSGTGLGVRFTPPVVPWNLTKIKVNGAYWCGDALFRI